MMQDCKADLPGGHGHLDECELAAPLCMVVQHLLQGQQLELYALEQVHVVHAHKHRLALKLHRQLSALSTLQLDRATEDERATAAQLSIWCQT